MMIAACGMLVTADSQSNSDALHLGATLTHPADPQVHLVDNVVCHDGNSILSGEENGQTFPVFECGDTYDLVPGAPALQYSNTVAHRGNRLMFGIGWADEAFGIGADAAIVDGTVVGGAYSMINIGCDDTPDYFVDETSSLPLDQSLYDPGLVPEALREQTTAWGPGTGLDGRDETFLTELIPPSFVPYVRYRADVNFVTLGDNLGVDLVNPISLNAIAVTPPWGNTRATITILGGDANAPSAQTVLCLDSPQISHSDLNASALLTNPETPGIYAIWTTYISAPGTRDEQIQRVSYITSCKHVGGPQKDDDNDCWADALDDMDNDGDRDGDGLLDGIELAWIGSDPCPINGLSPVATADCDGDGRQDAEEHFSVTNPRLPDTDGDELLDAGLNLDCNGDGQTDSGPIRSNQGLSSGRNRMLFAVMYCTPNGQNTMMGGLGGRPWGNIAATSEDNCPNKVGPQTNTSAADPDLDALPVPGDTNGRFGGTADVSHPDARFNGDICDLDDDNDGIQDVVESTMYYDADGTDLAYCNTDDVGAPAATLPDVRDTDADGTIDGVECNLGTNPADQASKPQAAWSEEQRIFFRLLQLTQQGTSMLINLDDGGTVLGLPEARGMGAGGASQMDHDRDGCVDEVESVDVDGTRSVADADRILIARAVLGVGNFAPLGSVTAEEVRTADIDFTGGLADADRIIAARITLSAFLPAIQDYNLNCKAAIIGYDAN